MDLNFNNLFGKESADLKIKDFPELPMIEGLEMSSDLAGLYKKKEMILASSFLKMALLMLEFIQNLQSNPIVLTGIKKLNLQKLRVFL